MSQSSQMPFKQWCPSPHRCRSNSDVPVLTDAVQTVMSQSPQMPFKQWCPSPHRCRSNSDVPVPTDAVQTVMFQSPQMPFKQWCPSPHRCRSNSDVPVPTDAVQTVMSQSPRMPFKQWCPSPHGCRSNSNKHQLFSFVYSTRLTFFATSGGQIFDYGAENVIIFEYQPISTHARLGVSWTITFADNAQKHQMDGRTLTNAMSHLISSFGTKTQLAHELLNGQENPLRYAL